MNTDTQRRIEFARQAERTLPDDLDWHLWAWEAVLQADAACTEARAAVARLTRQRAERDISGGLETVLPQAQRAAATHQVGELTALLDRVRAWRAQAATPPGLSPALTARLADLEHGVELLHHQTARRLAQVSDLIRTADYREAYRQARLSLERGILRLVDPETGAEVPTTELCAESRQRFLASLRRIAMETLVQAEDLGGYDPQAAIHRVQEARAQLADDALSSDDRVVLKPQREALERLQERLRERLDRFRQAQTRVLQALTRPDAEALPLLRQAQALFPDYPGLADALADVQARQAARSAARVASAVALARRQAAGDAFDAAAATLAQARTSLTAGGAVSDDDLGLRQALEDVTQAEREVAQAEGAHHRLMGLLGQVDGALAHAAQGDGDALALAGGLLAQLDTGEARHPQARQRQASYTLLATP